MYKKINRMSFRTTPFIPAIEEFINGLLSNFIDEFAYSIYSQCIKRSNKFSDDEKKFIESILKITEPFPLMIDNQVAIILLDKIIKDKMEAYLTVPFKNNSDRDSKKNEKTTNISFNEFTNIDDGGDSTDICKYIDDLYAGSDNYLNLESIMHEYFLLYRARTIILSKFTYRIYSEKTLTKVVKEISEDIRQKIYGNIIKVYASTLNKKDIEEVFSTLLIKFINDYTNQYRLGKTMEQGDEATRLLLQKIEKLDIKKIIQEQLNSEFEENFTELFIFDNFKNFSSIVENIYTKVLRDNNFIEGEVDSLDHELFKINVLGKILSSVDSSEKVIKQAYANLLCNDKCEIINENINNNLVFDNYTFAFRVEDMRISNKFFTSSLTHDIEAISHEMFTAWQYNIAEKLKVKDKYHVIDIPEDEKGKSTWFLVKNIKSGRNDSDMGYQIAISKLKDTLNFLYYFVSREDEVYFKIKDPYLCFNSDKMTLTLGRKQNSYLEPKKIDDFDENLIEFTSKVYLSNQAVHFRIRKAISMYNKLYKLENMSDKLLQLIKILRTIFNTYNNSKITIYSAIIIAGTNYNGNDITYNQMRKWLVQDFNNFIKVAEQNNCDYLKDEIFDRFRVFTKNIIGTCLFNIPTQSENQFEVEDIIKWILYINPSASNISKGGKDND